MASLFSHPLPPQNPAFTGSIAMLPLSNHDRERAVNRFIAAPQGPMTIMEIAGKLNINGDRHRAIIDQIRCLHKNHGFPEPANPRFVHGVRLRGERAIVWKSKWARDVVLAWFDHDGDPGTTALAAKCTREQTRHALAANAARLCAAGGAA